MGLEIARPNTIIVGKVFEQLDGIFGFRGERRTRELERLSERFWGNRDAVAIVNGSHNRFALATAETQNS